MVRLCRLGASRGSEGSRTLATQAVCASLEGGTADGSTGLLIYSGTLRDGHVVEPAQAALVLQSVNRAGTSFEVQLAFDVGHWLEGLRLAATFVDTKGGRAVVVSAEGQVGCREGRAEALRVEAGEGFFGFGAEKLLPPASLVELVWDAQQERHQLRGDAGRPPDHWARAAERLGQELENHGLSGGELSIRCREPLAEALDLTGMEVLSEQSFSATRGSSRAVSCFCDLDSAGQLRWVFHRGPVAAA